MFLASTMFILAATQAGDPSFAGVSDVDVGVQATSRFTERPQSACPAAAEYVRRGVQNSKRAAIIETILPYCRRNGFAGAPAVPTKPKPAATTAPPAGRYVCLRLSAAGNMPADELTIAPGGRYAVGGATGTFTSTASGIRWDSGPWATARSGWVARYEAPGPTARFPTIIVRRASDVAAGNARDLQWCNLS